LFVAVVDFSSSLILEILHLDGAFLHISIPHISSTPLHAHDALPHACIAAPHALPYEVWTPDFQQQISAASFGQIAAVDALTDEDHLLGKLFESCGKMGSI
jgi:hypothetical protein